MKEPDRWAYQALNGEGFSWLPRLRELWRQAGRALNPIRGGGSDWLLVQDWDAGVRYTS